MKKILFLLLIAFMTSSSSFQHNNDVIGYVNPFIGTDGHGHTFPGASMPFGMVQLSPDTRKDNWDACSGYHYSDSLIYGFSHTHLSGTGVGDYGDIRFMPVSSHLNTNPGSETEKGYRSHFTHRNEKASPGFYEVYLDDYQIGAEFTVTKRCGLHQYTFNLPGPSYILTDLTESVVSDRIIELFASVENDHAISGYRITSGWAENQKIYFYAEYSRPFDQYGIYLDGSLIKASDTASGQDLKVFVEYNTSPGEKILVKVGISSVSIEGAKNNLKNEMPGWDFDQMRINAENEWRKVLGKIQVEGDNENDKVKFYTALYHCYIAPNLFSDIDGNYRGHDGKIYSSSRDVYTVFSLWDTYRALHPLMTILEPDRTADFIQTFINIYQQGGLLPVWELAGDETFCMIGYHAVPVIADAYIKGIRDFNAEAAYTAMKSSAEKDHFGLDHYRKYGYIPAEAEGESISKTLEYAYDDWCIAMMARDLGYQNDYRQYIERAQYYKNLFDPETRFLRGKRIGMFTEPFDATEVNFMLTEANTWQYTFYVPQDISGLKELMGGDSLFEMKLDEMFTASTDLSGRQQADITGLIGQYAHGNEPSHHMAYLYNYVQNPAKTQKLVRQIMNDLYGAGPDGLCGNEDCGQMSAWFVMSALGFYPVTPAIGYYTIGSPLFDEVTINLDNGKKFIIKAKENSMSNVFIQSSDFNGKRYSKTFIDHRVLMQGGTLDFQMGSVPSDQWGCLPDDSPVSSISEYLITPVPFFQAASSAFQDSLTIQIRSVDKQAQIYYQIPSASQIEGFQEYREPLFTNKTIEIKAKAQNNKLADSKEVRASFHKIHNNWTVKVMFPSSPQYTGGGDMALIDGQRGGPNFRTGSWQGYQGVDFEAIVDLGNDTFVNKVEVTFLQDQRSWIFLPERVEISVSQNGMDFKEVANIENHVPDNTQEALIEVFGQNGMEETSRYIKVKGVNREVCPSWHVGAGDKAWIFVDEITIE